MKVSELFPDVISEDLNCEYKAQLNRDNPVKWAKTVVGYANGSGGVMFVGVSDDGEAFGIDLDQIDKTKNLIAVINDRHIFPHAKIRYMMRSVDENAEHFVLGVYVAPADSVVRYREGDFNETTETLYEENHWSEYLNLCREYREGASVPSVKDLQNEEIVSKEGYAKSGFMMFRDGYDGDDSLICCRLWKGTDKTGTVLDSARYKGSLAVVFRNALNFIERNTKTGWRKTGSGGREEIRSYPKEAVREALVNAIAHRDYSIAGTQIDVDIYRDRIDIVSPGSWLLPRSYEQYPVGSIPSVRRNAIIAACLDAANLMERGGTGFQTMIESYRGSADSLQPVVLVYPGFLDLRLFDRLYEKDTVNFVREELSDTQKILALLHEEGSKSVRDLQQVTDYKSRSQFLVEVINPLLKEGLIYRDGNPKSPRARFRLK